MPATQPDGYLALPRSGSGSAVLVLHAWWGLNDTMRGVCDRLAESGFVAFAPDLYHGEVTDTIEGAKALSRSLDEARANADIAGAIAFLRERAGGRSEGVAVIAFSLGVYFALEISATQPEQFRSVVIFYGTRPGDFKNAKAEYLGHFAENDEFEPAEEVQNLEASIRGAGQPVTFHHYPGTGHWFFEPDRPDAYDQAAATLAWDRTLAFLKR